MSDDHLTNIGSAIEWLSKNCFEWHLEVNDHNSFYESMQSYLDGQLSDVGDIVGEKDVSAWRNLYYVRAYPITAGSCYVMVGCDLLLILGAMIRCVERHAGWKTEGERTGEDFEGGPKLSKLKGDDNVG